MALSDSDGGTKMVMVLAIAAELDPKRMARYGTSEASKKWKAELLAAAVRR